MSSFFQDCQKLVFGIIFDVRSILTHRCAAMAEWGKCWGKVASYGIVVCLFRVCMCPLCPCIIPLIVFLHKKSRPDKVLCAVKIMPCLYVFISPWQFNYFWPHWRKPHKKLVFIQILIRNAGKLKQSCFEMLSFFPGLVLELCLNQHKRK